MYHCNMIGTGLLSAHWYRCSIDTVEVVTHLHDYIWYDIHFLWCALTCSPNITFRTISRIGLYTSMSREDFWMFAHVRSLSFTTHKSKPVHTLFRLLTDSLSLRFWFDISMQKNQLNHTWLQSFNQKLGTKGLTNVSQGFSTKIYGNNMRTNAIFQNQAKIFNQRFNRTTAHKKRANTSAA